MLKRELEKSKERSTSVEITARFKKDCLEEIFDAMASDSYRAFFERENGVHYRMEPVSVPQGGEIDGWVLHAVQDDVINDWDQKSLQRFDRRTMQHALPFGIGVIQVALASYVRAKRETSHYEPPQLQEKEAKSLRAIMMCHAYRRHIETQHQIVFGFLLPYRLQMTRATARGVPIMAEPVPSVGIQLRLESGDRTAALS